MSVRDCEGISETALSR